MEEIKARSDTCVLKSGGERERGSSGQATVAERPSGTNARGFLKSLAEFFLPS